MFHAVFRARTLDDGNRPAKVKVTHGCRVIIIILFTHWHTVHSKMYYTPTTFKRSTTLIKRLLVRFKQTSYIPRSKFRDHHTNSHSQRDHLQRYCYSRTYPHAHSWILHRSTTTQTLSYQGWIYMDAATPYLEDIHDLQRNIIHLHALRAIVICQHAAQEKQKHTAQQQLATMRAHMCSSPINIDIHAQEQHTHISQTDHSLRTLAIFTRHGRAIALFTLHATGKSLTTEGSAEGTAG